MIPVVAPSKHVDRHVQVQNVANIGQRFAGGVGSSSPSVVQKAVERRFVQALGTVVGCGTLCGQVRNALWARRSRQQSLQRPKRHMAMATASAGTSSRGDLFLYNEEFGMAAFEAHGEAGAVCGNRALICIAGMTDGLLSLRYMPALADALASKGWRVMQPVLGSSYSGWGISSLDSDVADIDVFLEHIMQHRGVEEFALLGHSTGCQDVVRYLKTGKFVRRVRAAILQAAVSDREAVANGADSAQMVKIQRYCQDAVEMIAVGRGDEVMARDAWSVFGVPHPVSASRYASLIERLGDDDMFSSDFSDDEFSERLGHVATPTLIVLSADDEYVPTSVDPHKLAKSMASAMAVNVIGRAEHLVLERGGHALRDRDAAKPFLAAVDDFLARAYNAPSFSWVVDVAHHVREKLSAVSSGRPLMVGLVGMPASGKSTSACAIARVLGPSCVVVPMDGFHLPMAALRELPDSADAIYRRGAPDTFDPAALRAKLEELRSEAGACEVSFPGFDHAAGDPTENAVVFDRSRHKVVIVEGLYLLHNDDGWDGMSELFDYTVYLEVDLELCICRIKERNKCIPGYTAEEIEERCDKIDRSNALVVAQSADRAMCKIALEET